MPKFLISATWDDVPHLTEQQKKELWESIPSHERDARAKGVPILGSGRIFPVDESLIAIPAFNIPRFWPQIGAMDFGWDHPFAAVRIAYDSEDDVVYVTHVFRKREQTPLDHARHLRAWGDWLPWAWPADGFQHSKDSGEPLKNQYAANGLNMIGSHAKFSDGSVGVEAGLFDMLERMQTGRFKVFDHLNEWFEEFRLYHRKDGKVVKEGDDLMAATRYGVMMLREAVVNPAEFKLSRQSAKQADPLEAYR